MATLTRPHHVLECKAIYEAWRPVPRLFGGLEPYGSHHDVAPSDASCTLPVLDLGVLALLGLGWNHHWVVDIFGRCFVYISVLLTPVYVLVLDRGLILLWELSAHHVAPRGLCHDRPVLAVESSPQVDNIIA